jgi:methylenetetrahydrofolate reductase (NADPH)
MAASPFSSNPKFQTLREQKEVNAGTQFFQTNLVYDIERLETLFNELAKRNVLYKVYMLMRITPPKSLKVAQILYKVPGIYLPKTVMEQMKTADQAGNAQEDGIQVALSSFTKSRGSPPGHRWHSSDASRLV